MRPVAIVGIGGTRFGRYTDISIRRLGEDACLKAIRDAGVKPRDIQLAYVGNFAQWEWGQGLLVGHDVLRELGVTRIPISLSLGAAGIDGMIDLPAGPGRIFVRGEINAIRAEPTGTATDRNTTVRMIGGGYLIRDRVQPFVRFDQVRGDTPQSGSPRDITYVG